MRLPLDLVLRRGVVFLWPKYDKLDDPALVGQSKSKYIVILSGSPKDDPLIYILTTSERAKHAGHPFPGDLQHIAAGAYTFFPSDTLIDAGTAGEREVGRDEFVALYQADSVVYQGVLTDAHRDELVGKILASRRVSKRFKQMLADS